MQPTFSNISSRRRQFLWAIQLVALIFLIGLPVTLSFANPSLPTVMHGQAHFADDGQLLTVTNSDGAIINWQSFSIGSGETTRFIQPGETSRVLNRIAGQDPSHIFGTLQSNGQVLLLNPNGVLFGAGAKVDVAGLLASTLSLSNEDFIAGRYNLNSEATGSAVENYGEIQAQSGGYVILAGPAVTNGGMIFTPDGSTLLAAGESLLLSEPDSPELAVVVSAPADQAINLGELIAPSGKVGIYAALINQGGLVRADSVTEGPGGQIFLRASKGVALGDTSVLSANGVTGGEIVLESDGEATVAGTVSAVGESGGGEIALLGGHVTVTGSSRIDASGGGGQILVGGDFQGKNEQIKNATLTIVEQGATLNSDGGRDGEGGEVIIWSDGATDFAGEISARGGGQSGDGGFVEVSGKETLTFNGSVDASAPYGELGTLLLDPTDIRVVAAGGNPANVTDVDQFADPNLGAGETAINSSVLDAAAADILLQAEQNIFVEDPLVLNTPGAGITMQAGGNIDIWAGIVTQGGDIDLRANDSAATNPSGTGWVGNSQAGSAILESRGGTISLSGFDVFNLSLNSSIGSAGDG
ncbi:MAG: hemagglutinin [Desulfuromonas sp.]|nr:MAG: hemagglutinin [Desulfuromonas sp.]